MNLAENLKKLRETKRLSQTELAARLGEGLSYYNKLEKEIMKPSVDVLVRLSKIYKITLDDIVYVNKAVLLKIKPEAVPAKRKYTVAKPAKAKGKSKGKGKKK